MNDAIVELSEEISKQNVEGASWFLLTNYSQISEERTDFKIELLSKRKQTERFGKFSAYLYCKK